MGSERAILDAIHNLTIVQRCAVSRPSLTQTTNAIGTQIVFQTNELMHVIASVWSFSSIQSTVDYWHYEITKLAAQISEHERSRMESCIRKAMSSLKDLIEVQRECEPKVMQKNGTPIKGA